MCRAPTPEVVPALTTPARRIVCALARVDRSLQGEANEHAARAVGPSNTRSGMGLAALRLCDDLSERVVNGSLAPEVWPQVVVDRYDLARAASSVMPPTRDAPKRRSLISGISVSDSALGSVSSVANGGAWRSAEQHVLRTLRVTLGSRVPPAGGGDGDARGCGPGEHAREHAAGGSAGPLRRRRRGALSHLGLPRRSSLAQGYRGVARSR